MKYTVQINKEFIKILIIKQKGRNLMNKLMNDNINSDNFL